MARPTWRWLTRSLAILCVPLAGLSARDAAIAWWTTRSTDPAPAWLGGSSLLRWTAIEVKARDAAWLAHHRIAVREAAAGRLRTSPLDASALRALGQIAALDGDSDGAEQFRTAEAITRRDPGTELALITLDARTGDIADGMRHYDHILRTAPDAKEALFRTLSGAIAYADVRAPLARYADRDWFAQFLDTAIDDGADPAAVVALFAAAQAAMPPGERRKSGLRIMTRLLAEGRSAQAREVAGAIPGIAPALGRLAPVGAASDPANAPLSWSFRNDEVVVTDLTNAGQLTVRVATGREAVAAQRTMLLPPGRYGLSHAVRYESGEPAARLTWTISCQGGAQLAALPVPVGTGRVRFEATIDVPTDCASQDWKLSAIPEETQAPSSVILDDLVLVKEPRVGKVG